MPAHSTLKIARAGAPVRRAPTCYFCSSTDTMEPFRKPARVFLLTAVLPRVRWRLCRHCGRHFLSLRSGRRRA